MQSILPLGEVRPSTTRRPDAPFTPPLYRLRGHDRPVITPETCLVQQCPICQWRREGLLDTPVVRECPSDYCLGCNATRCYCPRTEHLDAHIEQSYALGHDHGTADGPEHRPTRRWVLEAGLDLAYLDGYDEACAGMSPPSTVPLDLGRLWDTVDDGLPF